MDIVKYKILKENLKEKYNKEFEREVNMERSSLNKILDSFYMVFCDEKIEDEKSLIGEREKALNVLDIDKIKEIDEKLKKINTDKS